MLIIGVEFDVFAYGEQSTRIERNGAPFVVLTLVIGLDSNVRDEMIGADRHSSVECQFVPIAPGETAVFPVEIRAVAVRDREPSLQGKVRGRSNQHTIFGRTIGSDDVAVT